MNNKFSLCYGFLFMQIKKSRANAGPILSMYQTVWVMADVSITRVYSASFLNEGKNIASANFNFCNFAVTHCARLAKCVYIFFSSTLCTYESFSSH